MVLDADLARLMAAQESTRDILSRNLRSLMDDNRWSEHDVARKSGVAQKTVNKILNRQTLPRTDTVDRLAKAFGLASWQLTLPVDPEELSDTGSFKVLLSHYLKASPDGRQHINRVAEREADYSRK